MKQTLTQRVSRLEKIVKEYKQAVTTIEIPYTAMRSTGVECDKCPHEYCECVEYTPYERHEWNPHCSVCFKLIHPSRVGFKPIKPQEDVREKLAKHLFNEVWGDTKNIVWENQDSDYRNEFYESADRILAIVKGE